MNGVTGDHKKESNEVKHSGDENSQANVNKVKDEMAAGNEVGTEVAEIFDDMPPEMKKRISAFMSLGSISTPMLSPFHSKLNEKHIDKIIELGDKDNERMYKDTHQSRRFQLVYVLIGVSVFVFLTLLLVGKDTELFKEIIKLFVAFAGGMGVGFGIKSHTNSK